MPDPAADAGNATGRTPALKPSAAVLRRLPGKARAREDALREYQDFNAKRRSHLPGPLWPFWAPDPNVYYRWRVQLDCNCVTEVLTSGPDHRPDSTHWPDLVHGARLPMGQILCVHEDSLPEPYRVIIAWGSRRELTFPADPAEPPGWASAETWAVMRRDEPRACAFWTVTMSCGHVTEVAVSNLGWKPDDGPDRVSNERLREMTRISRNGGQSSQMRKTGASATIHRECSPTAGRTRPLRICATPALRRESSSRTKASAGLSPARPNRSPQDQHPGPACSGNCGKPRPKPTNCDANWPSWICLRSNNVTVELHGVSARQTSQIACQKCTKGIRRDRGLAWPPSRLRSGRSPRHVLMIQSLVSGSSQSRIRFRI